MGLAVAQLFPKTGFNVVGQDPFEVPGEAVYLIAGPYATLQEAEARVQATIRENGGADGATAGRNSLDERYFIYGPNGVVRRYP